MTGPSIYQGTFGVMSNGHDTWIEPELALDDASPCDCYDWPEVTYCHECRHDCHRPRMADTPPRETHQP